MDNLFNEILSNVSTEMTVDSAVTTILIAVLMGFAIAFTYFKTQEKNFQRSLAVTLLMLPAILSVIILFVGSNIARGSAWRERFRLYVSEVRRAIRRI